MRTYASYHVLRPPPPHGNGQMARAPHARQLSAKCARDSKIKIRDDCVLGIAARFSIFPSFRGTLSIRRSLFCSAILNDLDTLNLMFYFMRFVNWKFPVARKEHHAMVPVPSLSAVSPTSWLSPTP